MASCGRSSTSRSSTRRTPSAARGAGARKRHCQVEAAGGTVDRWRSSRSAIADTDFPVLAPVAVDRSPGNARESEGFRVFFGRLHLKDEGHRRQRLPQARVREFWKAGRQHRGLRLIYDEVGPTTAVPLQDLRRNRQPEYGHRVQWIALHSKGVRPGREPARRGREHFCDGPGHGSFPRHHRPMARTGFERRGALQLPDAAGL